MQARELSQLVMAAAESDADLEALITVRKATDRRARPTLANLRHALTSSHAGLVFLVARLGDEPVACGFVQRSTAAHAAADVSVVPSRRRRGVATAMLAEASAHAARLGKDRLQHLQVLEIATRYVALAQLGLVGLAGVVGRRRDH